MSEERVQKVLAGMGFGSRREIERWMEQGRIKINGKPCEPGDKVKSGDWVHVNGKRIIVRLEQQEPTRVIMYHKPVGQVCTRKDPEGRPTVFEHLPKSGRSRWISVGRLDINTSGLILFTNNGELANRLMHPSNEVEREYVVRVKGEVSKDILRQLTREVMLDDGPAHFDDIVDGGGEGQNHWYYVVIREGRKREVRRLWEHFGLQVSRLMRVRYGNIILPKSLRKGRSKDLEPADVEQLFDSVKLEYDSEKEAGLKRKSSTKKRRTVKSAKGMTQTSSLYKGKTSKQRGPKKKASKKVGKRVSKRPASGRTRKS